MGRKSGGNFIHDRKVKSEETEAKNDRSLDIRSAIENVDKNRGDVTVKQAIDPPQSSTSDHLTILQEVYKNLSQIQEIC